MLDHTVAAEKNQSETRKAMTAMDGPHDELLHVILSAIATNHANHIESTPKLIAQAIGMDEKTILFKIYKYFSESYLTLIADDEKSAVDSTVSLTATGWRYISNTDDRRRKQ